MKGRKPQDGAIRRGLTDSMNKQATASQSIGVQIPPDIEADPVQREIWGWVVPEVNHFTDQDLPQLRELVFWHAVFEQARAAIMSPNGDGKIAIFDKIGEKPFSDANGKRVGLYKKHPALSVMKEASAEIRALSDHLGLSPLARSRLGLMQATTVKTAAETAAMFRSVEATGKAIEAGYPELIEAEVVEDD